MIFIACGSNLKGQYSSCERVLYAAYEHIEAAGIKIISRSSIWVTQPVPISDQPWFRNSVIAVETDLPPQALLETLKMIEASFGRAQRAPRNAARILDLDIVSYHDKTIDTDGLKIPHPRLQERKFVLYPLKEVAPDWVHPALGMNISDLLAGL